MVSRRLVLALTVAALMVLGCTPLAPNSSTSTPTDGQTPSASPTPSVSGNSAGPYVASTFAGDIGWVMGLVRDDSGNLYVADRNSNLIRKITPAGTVTTLAGWTGAGDSRGYLDGTGTAAKFHFPEGIALAPDGNLYVADTYNHRIRKVTPEGVVTTFAGSTEATAEGAAIGPIAEAKFKIPTTLAFGPDGHLYVSDWYGRIYKIADGTVSYATPDWFFSPAGFAFTADGRMVVADSVYDNLTLVNLAGQTKTVLAGGTRGYADGNGDQARFSGPSSVALDGEGNVYVIDATNQMIRRVTPGGSVTTIAGGTEPGKTGLVNGDGAAARFNWPRAIITDGSGGFFVTDTRNSAIRRLARMP